ncbi:hypothetical protein [Nocardioides speluncae]|uniref:hypothetical protein n=1 Tax=Nocardioides speluncae TaxID=2670337 RepID=UPI000D69E806|nr:hypothetical protein [Nocardioides speluncae]
MIHVTVRDGRIGRDPARVTDEGGEILMEFETSEPLDVGHRLNLPDDTEVVVIGLTERLGAGWSQVVTVGNSFDPPQDTPGV